MMHYAPVSDRQIIFSAAVSHIRKQKRRCPMEGESYYRLGADRCPVGVMIDDMHYDSAMEGYRVRDLVKAFAMPAWFVENLELIDDLQLIHDRGGNWPIDRQITALARYAEERGLRMPA